MIDIIQQIMESTDLIPDVNPKNKKPTRPKVGN